MDHFRNTHLSNEVELQHSKYLDDLLRLITHKAPKSALYRKCDVLGRCEMYDVELLLAKCHDGVPHSSYPDRAI